MLRSNLAPLACLGFLMALSACQDGGGSNKKKSNTSSVEQQTTLTKEEQKVNAAASIQIQAAAAKFNTPIIFIESLKTDSALGKRKEISELFQTKLAQDDVLNKTKDLIRQKMIDGILVTENAVSDAKCVYDQNGDYYVQLVIEAGKSLSKHKLNLALDRCPEKDEDLVARLRYAKDELTKISGDLGVPLHIKINGMNDINAPYKIKGTNYGSGSTSTFSKSALDMYVERSREVFADIEYRELLTAAIAKTNNFVGVYLSNQCGQEDGQLHITIGSPDLVLKQCLKSFVSTKKK